MNPYLFNKPQLPNDQMVSLIKARVYARVKILPGTLTTCDTFPEEFVVQVTEKAGGS